MADRTQATSNVANRPLDKVDIMETTANVVHARTEPLYRLLASTIHARLSCIKTGNTEWTDKHEATVNMLNELLPHGAGLDGQRCVDLERSTGERIVICVEFHHMNDDGMYDGWTIHDIIVTPSLVTTIDVKVTGRNKNDVKGYLAEMFGNVLTADVMQSYDESTDRERVAFVG